MILLDQMAKRYGRLPSELLQLQPWELGLCLEAFSAGAGAAARALGPDGLVFAVRDVG